ncbi:MAG: hypothetical protein ACE5FJ_09405 [Gemmatimonadales bacterium]
MKLARSFSATTVAGALFLGACSGDNILTIEDLVGTWNAQSLTFAATGPLPALDLVAIGGSFTITLQADGSYTQVTNIPGAPVDTENGTLVLTNATETTATATLTSPGEADVFEIEFLGNTITLSGQAAHPADPTGATQTSVTAVLIRQ